MYKQNSPSVDKTAFNCPHCRAYAKQDWFTLYAEARTKYDPLPPVIRPQQLAQIPYNNKENAGRREQLSGIYMRMSEGHPFLEKTFSEIEGSGFSNMKLTYYNVFVSTCYNCNKDSIWIYDKLVFPKSGKAPPANPDLSDDIRRDYDEASSILDLSPRGAAALIRLTMQKLCKELGKPGKNLNDDIRALVAEGLDERIQKALDIVRVIGNNAVHPGKIDLRDDRKTAESLFDLLNLIAEKMISQPKHVDEFYERLPEDARKAIKESDGDQGS